MASDYRSSVGEKSELGEDREQSLSLKKAIRILRCFGHSSPDLTVADLVRLTGLPRTVCYRLITTLEGENLLVRDPDTSRYRIGMALFQIGGVALAGLGIRSAAASELALLSKQTGDTVCLVIENGSDALCIDRFDGDFPIQHTALSMGKTMPLHVGGAPFALLAHMPEERREVVLREPLQACNSRSVTAPPAIRARAEEVRRLGYAVGDEDVIEYLTAIGIPLFGFDGRLVAAFSVGGLKQRYAPDRILEVSQIARETGMRISARLGYDVEIQNIKYA